MPPAAEGLASRLFLGPALRTQPDRRLVTLVREGYEAAFEEIVRRYGRPLGRYAASIVGNRSEDVTQDAFSKALLSLRRNDSEIELRPWLFRIVRNTALNELRDSPPSPKAPAEVIAGGADPAEELERREELADLMRRLRALPKPQRAAIVMRELEGLGHEEIAAALGLTGGGARQAIYRARQALRDGAGMLIPLPLIQALLAGSGSGVAETAGMGAAGIGGATGAGVALKATAATVLVAGAVGAGVALKDSSRGAEAKAAPARILRGADTASAPVLAARDIGGGGNSRRAPGAEENRGGPSAEAGRGGGESSGAGATSHSGRGSGGGEGRGPSHSGSSGRDGGGSGHGSDDSSHSGRDGGDSIANEHSGSGSDFESGEGGSGSGGDESSLEGGEGSHSGPGSGGETEESISSGGDSGGSGSPDGGGDGSSGDSGDPLRDLSESSGLTE